MRYWLIFLSILLVGCTLPDKFDDIIVTPTLEYRATATSTVAATPVIITATPEPTATASMTPTRDPDFIPSPTPIVDINDECDWESGSVVCAADQCNIRLEPLPGPEYIGYGVPRDTRMETFAVCELGNEVWYYAGVTRNNDELWLRGLDTIWKK